MVCKKDEHCGSLLCRIPVAVRTEQGSDITLLELGAKSRKPVLQAARRSTCFYMLGPKQEASTDGLLQGPSSLAGDVVHVFTGFRDGSR